MILFQNYHPILLYHSTPKNRLAKIRREGLKPHVPGKVWGVDRPIATNGKRVVWLTTNGNDWQHDRHPNKKMRNPEVRLLTVWVHWRDKKLHHYASWRDPKKRLAFTRKIQTIRSHGLFISVRSIGGKSWLACIEIRVSDARVKA